MNHSQHNYLADFITDLQSKGRYSFSLPELRSAFSVGDGALKLALHRLVLKNRVCPVRRNFYAIIPPEYMRQRILPAAMFIDDLMRFVNKPYYVGLLSAASFYGASHQRPQEFFVVTVKPALRRVSVRGVTITSLVRTHIDVSLIGQRQTETGYLSISSPELTALDLVCFSERAGGLSRAAQVIGELIPSMSKRGIQKLAMAGFPSPGLQRLGFLLDKHPGSAALSDTLLAATEKRSFRNVLLRPGGAPSISAGNRWKVAENVNVLPVPAPATLHLFHSTA